MELPVIVHELRTLNEEYKKRLTDKEPATAIYCNGFCSILQKFLAKHDGSYEEYVFSLCIFLCHYAASYGELAVDKSKEKICQQLFRLCIKAVLDVKWKELSEDNTCRQKFRETVDAVHTQLERFDFYQFHLVKGLMESHWDHPTLSRIMAGADDLEEQEVMEYFAEEDPVVLKVRVETLLDENCEEFALNLCRWCCLHPALVDNVEIRETQLFMLYSNGNLDKMQEECAKITSEMSVQIIRNLQEYEAEQSFCVMLAQTFLVQNWVRGLSADAGTKILLKLWIRLQYLVDGDLDKFSDSIWAIAKLSQHTEQITFLVEALQEEAGETFLELNTNLCVYAFNLDKGCLEQAVADKDMELILCRNVALSKTSQMIMKLYHDLSPRLCKLSAVTAFALDPSEENFEIVYTIFHSVNLGSLSANNRIASQPEDNLLDSNSPNRFVNKLSNMFDSLHMTPTKETKRLRTKTKIDRNRHSMSHRTVDNVEYCNLSVNPATLYEVERLLDNICPFHLDININFMDLQNICMEHLIRHQEMLMVLHEDSTDECSDYSSNDEEADPTDVGGDLTNLPENGASTLPAEVPDNETPKINQGCIVPECAQEIVTANCACDAPLQVIGQTSCHSSFEASNAKCNTGKTANHSSPGCPNVSPRNLFDAFDQDLSSKVSGSQHEEQQCMMAVDVAKTSNAKEASCCANVPEKSSRFPICTASPSGSCRCDKLLSVHTCLSFDSQIDFTNMTDSNPSTLSAAHALRGVEKSTFNHKSKCHKMMVKDDQCCCCSNSSSSSSNSSLPTTVTNANTAVHVPTSLKCSCKIKFKSGKKSDKSSLKCDKKLQQVPESNNKESQTNSLSGNDSLEAEDTIMNDELLEKLRSCISAQTGINSQNSNERFTLSKMEKSYIDRYCQFLKTVTQFEMVMLTQNFKPAAKQKRNYLVVYRCGICCEFFDQVSDLKDHIQSVCKSALMDMKNLTEAASIFGTKDSVLSKIKFFKCLKCLQYTCTRREMDDHLRLCGIPLAKKSSSKPADATASAVVTTAVQKNELHKPSLTSGHSVAPTDSLQSIENNNGPNISLVKTESVPVSEATGSSQRLMVDEGTSMAAETSIKKLEPPNADVHFHIKCPEENADKNATKPKPSEEYFKCQMCGRLLLGPHRHRLHLEACKKRCEWRKDRRLKRMSLAKPSEKIHPVIKKEHLTASPTTTSITSLDTAVVDISTSDATISKDNSSDSSELSIAEIKMEVKPKLPMIPAEKPKHCPDCERIIKLRKVSQQLGISEKLLIKTEPQENPQCLPTSAKAESNESHHVIAESKVDAATAIVAPSSAAVVAPSSAAVVAPSSAAVVAPSSAAVVAPSSAAVVAPSSAAVVAPSSAAVVAPPSAAVVVPPSAAVVTPPSAAVIVPSSTAMGVSSSVTVVTPSTIAVNSPSATDVVVMPSTAAVVSPSAIGAVVAAEATTATPSADPQVANVNTQVLKANLNNTDECIKRTMLQIKSEMENKQIIEKKVEFHLPRVSNSAASVVPPSSSSPQSSSVPGDITCRNQLSVSTNCTVPTPSQNIDVTKCKVVSIGETPLREKYMSNPSPYCRKCDFCFRSRSNFVKHLAITHLQPYTKETNPDPNSNTVTFHCNFCQGSFQIWFKFINHIPNHAALILESLNCTLIEGTYASEDEMSLTASTDMADSSDKPVKTNHNKSPLKKTFLKLVWPPPEEEVGTCFKRKRRRSTHRSRRTNRQNAPHPNPNLGNLSKTTIMNFTQASNGIDDDTKKEILQVMNDLLQKTVCSSEQTHTIMDVGSTPTSVTKKHKPISLPVNCVSSSRQNIVPISNVTASVTAAVPKSQVVSQPCTKPIISKNSPCTPLKENAPVVPEGGLKKVHKSGTSTAASSSSSSSTLCSFQKAKTISLEGKKMPAISVSPHPTMNSCSTFYCRKPAHIPQKNEKVCSFNKIDTSLKDSIPKSSFEPYGKNISLKDQNSHTLSPDKRKDNPPPSKKICKARPEYIEDKSKGNTNTRSCLMSQQIDTTKKMDFVGEPSTKKVQDKPAFTCLQTGLSSPTSCRPSVPQSTCTAPLASTSSSKTSSASPLLVNPATMSEKPTSPTSVSVTIPLTTTTATTTSATFDSVITAMSQSASNSIGATLPCTALQSTCISEPLLNASARNISSSISIPFSTATLQMSDITDPASFMLTQSSASSITPFVTLQSPFAQIITADSLSVVSSSLPLIPNQLFNPTNVISTVPLYSVSATNLPFSTAPSPLSNLTVATPIQMCQSFTTGPTPLISVTIASPHPTLTDPISTFNANPMASLPSIALNAGVTMSSTPPDANLSMTSAPVLSTSSFKYANVSMSPSSSNVVVENLYTANDKTKLLSPKANTPAEDVSEATESQLNVTSMTITDFTTTEAITPAVSTSLIPSTTEILNDVITTAVAVTKATSALNIVSIEAVSNLITTAATESADLNATTSNVCSVMQPSNTGLIPLQSFAVPNMVSPRPLDVITTPVITHPSRENHASDVLSMTVPSITENHICSINDLSPISEVKSDTTIAVSTCFTPVVKTLSNLCTDITFISTSADVPMSNIVSLSPTSASTASNTSTVTACTTISSTSFQVATVNDPVSTSASNDPRVNIVNATLSSPATCELSSDASASTRAELATNICTSKTRLISEQDDASGGTTSTSTSVAKYSTILVCKESTAVPLATTSLPCLTLPASDQTITVPTKKNLTPSPGTSTSTATSIASSVATVSLISDMKTPSTELSSPPTSTNTETAISKSATTVSISKTTLPPITSAVSSTTTILETMKPSLTISKSADTASDADSTALSVDSHNEAIESLNAKTLSSSTEKFSEKTLPTTDKINPTEPVVTLCSSAPIPETVITPWNTSTSTPSSSLPCTFTTASPLSTSSLTCVTTPAFTAAPLSAADLESDNSVNSQITAPIAEMPVLSINIISSQTTTSEPPLEEENTAMETKDVHCSDNDLGSKSDNCTSEEMEESESMVSSLVKDCPISENEEKVKEPESSCQVKNNLNSSETDTQLGNVELYSSNEVTHSSEIASNKMDSSQSSFEKKSSNCVDDGRNTVCTQEVKTTGCDLKLSTSDKDVACNLVNLSSQADPATSDEDDLVSSREDCKLDSNADSMENFEKESCCNNETLKYEESGENKSDEHLAKLDVGNELQASQSNDDLAESSKEQISETINDGKPSPDDKASLDEKSLTNEKSLLDEKSSPDGETLPDEKSSPDEQMSLDAETLPDEKSSPNGATLPDEKSSPDNETLPDKKSSPGSKILLNKKSSPDDKTLPNEKSSPGDETLPDEKSPPNGETLPDEKSSSDGETLPDKKLSPDSETLPDKISSPDGKILPDEELSPDEKSSPDGETLPDEKSFSDEQLSPNGETLPDEKSSPDGKTLPDKKSSPDSETLLDEKSSPDEQSSPDGETLPDKKSSPDGETLPDEKSSPDGENLPDEQSCADGETLLDEKSSPDGKKYLDEKSSSDGETLPDGKASPNGKTLPGDKTLLDEKSSADDEPSPDVKSSTSDKSLSAEKSSTDDKSSPDVKLSTDDKSLPDIKSSMDDKSSPDVKSSMEDKSSPDVKSSMEDKSSPDAKSSTDGKSSPDAKSSTDGKSSPDAKSSTDGKLSKDENPIKECKKITTTESQIVLNSDEHCENQYHNKNALETSDADEKRESAESHSKQSGRPRRRPRKSDPELLLSSVASKQKLLNPGNIINFRLRKDRPTLKSMKCDSCCCKKRCQISCVQNTCKSCIAEVTSACRCNLSETQLSNMQLVALSNSTMCLNCHSNNKRASRGNKRRRSPSPKAVRQHRNFHSPLRSSSVSNQNRSINTRLQKMPNVPFKKKLSNSPRKNLVSSPHKKSINSSSRKKLTGGNLKKLSNDYHKKKNLLTSRKNLAEKFPKESSTDALTSEESSELLPDAKNQSHLVTRRNLRSRKSVDETTPIVKQLRRSKSEQKLDFCANVISKKSIDLESADNPKATFIKGELSQHNRSLENKTDFPLTCSNKEKELHTVSPENHDKKFLGNRALKELRQRVKLGPFKWDLEESETGGRAHSMPKESDDAVDKTTDSPNPNVDITSKKLKESEKESMQTSPASASPSANADDELLSTGITPPIRTYSRTQSPPSRIRVGRTYSKASDYQALPPGVMPVMPVMPIIDCLRPTSHSSANQLCDIPRVHVVRVDKKGNMFESREAYPLARNPLDLDISRNVVDDDKGGGHRWKLQRSKMKTDGYPFSFKKARIQ